jgi:uncharacterized 2Fe-2S/4Fe-4S cluster protein (DUF4445 family)
MADQQVRITFQPQGRAVFVLPGTKILEAAGRAGLAMDTPCGGAGTCGKCRVRMTSGVCEPSEAADRFFSKSELAAGWRLACQSVISRDCVVHVPDTSLFGVQHKILAERQVGAAGEVVPAVRKIYVELAEPTLEDGIADLARLSEKIGPAKADLDVVRQLPKLLRKNGFRGTAVLADHHLIDFEPGDTTAECYGAAFDIGTTTVVGSLLDLSSGGELALASRINPQVSYGDDVLSRIQRAGESDEHLQLLQKEILSAIADMITELCAQSGAKRQRIYEVAFAGNTTMEHLLCGIDVQQLGMVPFVPAYERGLIVPAARLGVPIHPRATAYVFPVIGGFVGGDTVAGIIATKLDELEGPVLMVDIGTNGEIVLACDGRLWAASTAAGPAFEGARISCGMRASAGAIEKIVFDDDVRFSVIGGGEPAGFCGSALIDAAAELLRSGIISPEGRFRSPDELPRDLPPAIAARVVVGPDGQTAFRIADGRGGVGLTVTQRDIRELQLAAGAVRAGMNIMLRRAGIASRDLKRVLIAGGFGSFIRRSNAQRIGLLPGDVDHSRINYVGNASLDGAKCALLSTRARTKAEQLARGAVHLQLSEDEAFQTEFVEAMIFPSK